MTDFPIPVSPGRMGRPTLNVKPTMVRLSEEVRQRIRALVGANGMATFIREAIENELARREKKAKLKPRGE